MWKPDAEAEVNAHGGGFGNALQATSYNAHEEVVQMLLDARAEVNAEGGEHCNAPQAAPEGGREGRDEAGFTQGIFHQVGAFHHAEMSSNIIPSTTEQD